MKNDEHFPLHTGIASGEHLASAGAGRGEEARFGGEAGGACEASRLSGLNEPGEGLFAFAVPGNFRAHFPFLDAPYGRLLRCAAILELAFWITAVWTVVAAGAALSFRNPVHCALCLVLAFAGLAAFYLGLGAEFVGFAQILVYIGAVAILIVFAILLTRTSEVQETKRGFPWAGLAVAAVVFVALAGAIRSSDLAARTPVAQAKVTVKQLGLQMFQGSYILALEVAGLLLTAALIGAAVIALQEYPKRQ